MISYTIRRFLGIAFTLFLLSIFTFVLSRTIPGGPWLQGAQIPMSSADIAAFKAQYVLNQPVLVQYAIWLWNAVRLNFLACHLQHRN